MKFPDSSNYFKTHSIKKEKQILWHLYSDNSFQVETVDIIDARDCDLGAGVIHNFLDGGACLPDDATDQVVVSKDLQGHLSTKGTMQYCTCNRARNGRLFLFMSLISETASFTTVRENINRVVYCTANIHIRYTIL